MFPRLSLLPLLALQKQCRKVILFGTYKVIVHQLLSQNFHCVACFFHFIFVHCPCAWPVWLVLSRCLNTQKQWRTLQHGLVPSPTWLGMKCLVAFQCHHSLLVSPVVPRKPGVLCRQLKQFLGGKNLVWLGEDWRAPGMVPLSFLVIWPVLLLDDKRPDRPESRPGRRVVVLHTSLLIPQNRQQPTLTFLARQRYVVSLPQLQVRQSQSKRAVNRSNLIKINTTAQVTDIHRTIKFGLLNVIWLLAQDLIADTTLI